MWELLLAEAAKEAPALIEHGFEEFLKLFLVKHPQFNAPPPPDEEEAIDTEIDLLRKKIGP